MTHYSQYGEEYVIDSFFNKKKNGFCVDIGAADGIRYSNSRYLIEELNWSGVLVEPHPTFFDNLKELYKNTDTISLLNIAIHTKTGKLPFYVYGRDKHAQVSTLSESFKERVIIAHGDKYEDEAIIVNVETLENILKDSPFVDFLSVDCEGVDMEVMKSNDWNVYRPTLVCVELSMPEEEVVEFMSSVDYKLYQKTAGNIFFK
tara:strand:+ start:223 stop:831 length:609 start_codon:yes stop_codon:yes gene_type:complete